MKFKTIYLNFSAPLHLGNYKPEGYEQSEVFLRSDTIVAAVMHAWALTGREELIRKYIDNPRFFVSSAFPFKKDVSGEIVHFFPRPKIRWEYGYDPDLSKKIKKVNWVDKDYFEKIIGKYKLDEDKKIFTDSLQDEFLSQEDLSNGIYEKELLERVKIPRDINEDSTPFYMERIRFKPGAGLYFLVEAEEYNDLKTGLEILQDEGFGTDKNVGNGYFEFSEGEINISVPENTEKITNLGLFCPENKEQLKDYLTEDSVFSIIKRGGWITHPGFQTYRKKNLYMFEEGSVFAGDDKLAGKVNIDLTPDRMNDENIRILRNGKTIFVPVKT